MGKPNQAETYIGEGVSILEGREDYFRVIWIGTEYRIIRSVEDNQYIIQRKESDRWRSLKYCFNQVELDLECGRLNLPTGDSLRPLKTPLSPVGARSKHTHLKELLAIEGSLIDAV